MGKEKSVFLHQRWLTQWPHLIGGEADAGDQVEGRFRVWPLRQEYLCMRNGTHRFTVILWMWIGDVVKWVNALLSPRKRLLFLRFSLSERGFWRVKVKGFIDIGHVISRETNWPPSGGGDGSPPLTTPGTFSSILHVVFRIIKASLSYASNMGSWLDLPFDRCSWRDRLWCQKRSHDQCFHLGEVHLLLDRVNKFLTSCGMRTMLSARRRFYSTRTVKCVDRRY